MFYCKLRSLLRLVELDLPPPSLPLSLSLSPFPLSVQDYPAVLEGLDLVQEEDQITHLLSLSDSHDGEDLLNVFQEDSDYLTNEDKYKEIKAGMYIQWSRGSLIGREQWNLR